MTPAELRALASVWEPDQVVLGAIRARDVLGLLDRLDAAEREVERLRRIEEAARALPEAVHADLIADTHYCERHEMMFQCGHGAPALCPHCRAETAERERDEAWSDLHLVAEAAGAMHDQSTGPSYPGTAEEVTAAIQTLRRERDALHAITLDVMRERDEARAEIDKLHAIANTLAHERDKYARLHSEAEAQIACRNELRYRAEAAEARVRALRAVRDAAEAYVAAIDSAVDNPADFLGSIEREKQALVNIRAALRAAARGTT